MSLAHTDISAVGVAGRRRSSRLWMWVVAAFLLQLAAWVAWFTIASQHRVEEVPLEHSRFAPAGADVTNGHGPDAGGHTGPRERG